MYDDVDKLKLKYAKEVEQGTRIETLSSNGDFQFFMGWIKASQEEITRRIMDGEFLSSQRQEDFNKGIVAGLKMFTDGVDRFVKQAKAARKKVKELDDAED